MKKSIPTFSSYVSVLSILLLFIDLEQEKISCGAHQSPKFRQNIIPEDDIKKIQEKIFPNFGWIQLFCLEEFQAHIWWRFKSALKHPFLRSYSISYWSKRRIWPVYKDLAKPRKRSQKQKSLLRERSFGATPTQKHRELKLKSLQGTKSNHCFLASDKQIGVINYRPLPCLEKCCLEEADWKRNVPSYKKCKWGKYTGRWRYWNFPNDGGDWAIPDDDYSTSEENWIILEMSRSPTRYNWYARCIDYTIQSAKEKTITRRPHRWVSYQQSQEMFSTKD